MRSMNIEDIISAVLGGAAKPVSEQDLIGIMDCNTQELQERYGISGIGGMVFLPSGSGYLLPDEEHTKNERSDTK